MADTVYKFVDINGNEIEEKLHCISTKHGLMCPEDKTKLTGIEEGANKYIHPSTHPATMITEDETHRFVTDEEKIKWNNGSSIEVATSTSNGLMSSTDKTKLDSIEEQANKYIHPTSHPATMITEDATHRFVTDEEKSNWNNKAAKDLSNIDNETFKAKVEASGFNSGAVIQICTWEDESSSEGDSNS